MSPSLVATSVLREIPRRDEAFRKRQKGCQCKESVLVCGCVLFVCMGTFVSRCSRNICLFSKGMDVLLGGEGGGWEGAQEADSYTSGLLCDRYSRGKWGLSAGTWMVSCGMTSCDLPLVL